jgi:hypothetical protein
MDTPAWRACCIHLSATAFVAVRPRSTCNRCCGREREMGHVHQQRRPSRTAIPSATSAGGRVSICVGQVNEIEARLHYLGSLQGQA